MGIFTKKYSPWVTCLTSALFYFYVAIQIAWFDTLAPSIIQEFSMTAVQYSELSSLFLLGMVIFLLPAGLLLDRYSIKKILLITCALSSLLTITFGLSQNILCDKLINFLLGTMGAFSFLPSVKLTSRLLPHNKIAMATGLIITIGMFGGIVAQSPLFYLQLFLGWRHMLITLGILGFCITTVISIFVNVDDAPTETIEHHTRCGQKILLNYQNWLFALFTATLNLPLLILASEWMQLYLQKTHNISLSQASYMAMSMFLGVMIGAPLAGFLSDRLRSRKKIMLIGPVLSLISILIIMQTSHLSFLLLLLIFSCLGLSTGCQVMGFTAALESNQASNNAAATSLVSIFVTAGGVIFQPVFALLLQWHWDGQYAQGMPLYEPHNYHDAMLLFPISLLLCLIIVFFIKEPFKTKT